MIAMLQHICEVLKTCLKLLVPRLVPQLGNVGISQLLGLPFGMVFY